MSIPTCKNELKDAIENSYRKLTDDLKDIPIELTEIKELDGHVKNTKMSVCNLLSYLVGWGNLVLKWHKISSQGKIPDLPETGFKMNEFGRLAQKFYKDYENENFTVLMDKFEDVVEELLNIINSMENDELYEKLWYKNYPFGRMIQLNTSSPYKNARGRIRKWKKLKGLM